ncbi:sulfotransferase [Lacibacter sediminis]|nr:sulfotransferase [Lacibacter sediminis]
MRWFNTKRILISLILVPIFTICLIINRFFLLLDHVFFPHFIRQSIRNPVFIVAAPRSGTTYLFHTLAADKNNFTTFKLWEIILAPSIIQKYFFLGLLKCDRTLGSPLKKVILSVENRLLDNFKHIHKIGLSLPEEDEAILLWNMSTFYLNFFFPDTNYFNNYFAFDDKMTTVNKERIMRYYRKCVQRHNFVFNRRGTKKFLSKNPAMMSKVKSLHQFFGDATIVTITRCPSKTIPSTIALNNSIYAFFTSKAPGHDINERTKNILINWYKMAHENITAVYSNQTINLSFNGLIKNEQSVINNLCGKLGIEDRLFSTNQDPEKLNHISRNKYTALGDSELQFILEKMPFISEYCTEEKMS